MLGFAYCCLEVVDVFDFANYFCGRRNIFGYTVQFFFRAKCDFSSLVVAVLGLGTIIPKSFCKNVNRGFQSCGGVVQ